MKGSTIREGLARVRMTQTKLARLLGITPQAVAGIFAASDVRTGTVERICEVLNLPVTYFYDDVPDCGVTHGGTVTGVHILNGTAPDRTKDATDKDREIQYLRGQVAAYETALSLLHLTPLTSPDPAGGREI